MKGTDIGSNIYILRKECKLLPSANLLVSREGIRPIPSSEMHILKKLQTRPLLENEVKKLPHEIHSYLQKVRFFYPDGYPLYLEANYIVTEEENALAWKMVAKTKFSYRWGEEIFKLDAGQYFFLNYKPLIIEGDVELISLRSSDPASDRDEWILEKIKTNPQRTIVELGAGVEARLKNKIKKTFPAAEYIGIDLQENHVSSNLRGNFLVSYPKCGHSHLVVLEEVIEHLEEEDVKKLINLSRTNHASQMIITTPNAEFTFLLGLTTRHADHKFEWDREDMETFVKEIVPNLATDVKIEEIGRRVNGVFPTWGIIITF